MTETTDALEELPPSAVLVYKVLDHADGELTQDEIAGRSHRSHSTVQKALYRLEDAGLIESRTVYSDARRTVYSTIN